MRTIKVIAPAKVNLFLGIGPRRSDGYHDVTTAMHALALHDTIQMTQINAGEEALLVEPGDAAQPLRELQLSVEEGSGLAASAHTIWTAGLDPVEIADADNLACRAVHELAREVGRESDEHVRLVIEKHIPAQAGMGGGSADAAAALVGAATLWGLDPAAPEVERAARKLSVDVAFFLQGGCALLDDRGDRLSHTLAPRRDTVVVVKPQGGVSSASAYAAFDENPVVLDQDVLAQLQSAGQAQDVPLLNNLAPASETIHADLARVRAFLQDQPGVEEVLLCGSGAATFAICRDFATAQAVVSAAQQQGWWARATSFASLGAALLPS